MVNLRQQSKVINKKTTNFRYCSPLFAQTTTSRSSVNSAKQAGHLLSLQSSLVILYANGMYGMLTSAHNDSQMLLRNIRESKTLSDDVPDIDVIVGKLKLAMSLSEVEAPTLCITPKKLCVWAKTLKFHLNRISTSWRGKMWFNTYSLRLYRKDLFLYHPNKQYQINQSKV